MLFILEQDREAATTLGITPMLACAIRQANDIFDALRDHPDERVQNLAERGKNDLLSAWWGEVTGLPKETK